MRIKFSPQRSDDSLVYQWFDETIIANLNGVEETFDFSELPDNREAQIESSIDPCPVIKAERINGELIVTLRTLHGPNAPYEDRFPEDVIV